MTVRTSIDMLYFIFRDDGTLYGGPYLDEAVARRWAEGWTAVDGTTATIVGVDVMYHALVSPPEPSTAPLPPSDAQAGRLARQLRDLFQMPYQRALDLAKDVLPAMDGIEIRDQARYDAAVRKHLDAWDDTKQLMRLRK